VSSPPPEHSTERGPDTAGPLEGGDLHPEVGPLLFQGAHPPLEVGDRLLVGDWGPPPAADEGKVATDMATNVHLVLTDEVIPTGAEAPDRDHRPRLYGNRGGATDPTDALGGSRPEGHPMPHAVIQRQIGRDERLATRARVPDDDVLLSHVFLLQSPHSMTKAWASCFTIDTVSYRFENITRIILSKWYDV